MLLSNEPSQIDERLFARFTVNASWLIKLRWVAVIGQLITIVFVWQFLEIRVPLVPLCLVLLITSLSNVALEVWFFSLRRRESDHGAWRSINRALAIVMTLDLASLTTMLYLTGGPNNPFSLFFFVNLCLCAVVLTTEMAWALTLLSFLCFTGLIYQFVPLSTLTPESTIQSIAEAKQVSVTHAGLMVAFATCASVIVYFMTRVNHELRASEIERMRAEASQARNEKLQALGTLAAGAAHELSTPLSTIAVVAREVEDEIESLSPSPHLSEDIRLIRAELDRCRHILDRMSGEAGQVSGEGLSSLTAKELILETLEGLQHGERIDVQEVSDLDEVELNVPKGVLTQTIRGMLQNALDASTQEQKVVFRIELVQDQLEFQIVDQGHGMSDEVMKRVSEPFFTTKEPGKGMGLGMFLARTVIEQLGGSIEIESQPNVGTEVAIRLPLHDPKP